MSDLLTGSQRPTLSLEPPDASDWRLSDIAVEWAHEVAGYVLDEWQQWLVRWAFARRPDGLWAARDVGIEVGRQNGKNIVLEVIELVGLFEFGDRLITHSAHRADVSHEHFVSLQERIQGSDDLMALMPSSMNKGFITTNGNESIKLKSGARLLFKARAKASGRGPRPQKVVFDEALVLEQGQVGSMAPSISAQRNPQIIFASSPPMATSEVLHRLRERAVSPEDGDRLFYAAWNNPAGTEVSDRDALLRVNPSLGYGRITETSLLANRRLMSEAEFLREHLGVAETPVALAPSAVPFETWATLADAGSKIATHRCMALEVAIDRSWSSFGAAGRREDGLAHVETIERAPGTGWVLARAVELYQKWKLPIRVDRSGPAAPFIALLREASVEVHEVSTQEHAQAVGQFIDSALSGRLRHLGGDPFLDAAVRGAILRPVGDVEVWARRTSKVEITPLVAVTLALGGVPAPAPTGGLFVAVT